METVDCKQWKKKRGLFSLACRGAKKLNVFFNYQNETRGVFCKNAISWKNYRVLQDTLLEMSLAITNIFKDIFGSFTAITPKVRVIPIGNVIGKHINHLSNLIKQDF